jgi:hypothetical protein
VVRQTHLGNEHDAAASELRLLSAALGLPANAIQGSVFADATLHGMEQAWSDAARVERGEVLAIPMPTAPTPGRPAQVISSQATDSPQPAGSAPVPQAVKTMASPSGRTGVGNANSSSASVEQPRSNARSISRAVDAFLTKHAALPARLRGNDKSPRDIDVARRLFVSLVGDVGLDRLWWQAVVQFRDAALMIPKYNGKGIFAGLDTAVQVALADAIDIGDERTVREILPSSAEPEIQAALAKKPVARSTMKSVNKHLSSLNRAVLPWYNANRGREQIRGWTPSKREFFPKKQANEGLTFIRTALSDNEIAAISCARSRSHDSCRASTWSASASSSCFLPKAGAAAVQRNVAHQLLDRRLGRDMIRKMRRHGGGVGHVQIIRGVQHRGHVFCACSDNRAGGRRVTGGEGVGYGCLGAAVGGRAWRSIVVAVGARRFVRHRGVPLSVLTRTEAPGAWCGCCGWSNAA